MKIPNSIRQLYEEQKAVNERLKLAVDERIRNIKKHNWHYESRVKELQSFTLKIETGRFTPTALEDFFACTLVVPNVAEISEAEQLIRYSFTVSKRRPKNSGQTYKSADSFPFDDLRLYATYTQNPALPPSDLINIRFEVQIKTFLQHAWAIATHDLIYKSDEANWSKARIAYQIKAMLEHAEISIEEAERLSSCNTLAKEDQRTANTKEVISLIKRQWKQDELPHDVRRLAENTVHLLDELQLSTENLEQILNEEKDKRYGAHPTNLSPHAIIVQYLFNSQREKLIQLLEQESLHTKILIPREIEIPDDIDRGRLRNALFT